MHYPRDEKTGKLVIPKGEKEPEPQPDIDKVNEERLKMAAKEVEDRRKAAGPGSLEVEREKISKDISEPKKKKK